MTELKLQSAKLMVMSSTLGLCVEKKKTDNSWCWIVHEDMTDEKFDVIGDHFAGGVKWRYQQYRGKFCT